MRKTFILRLLDADVPINYVAQLSGNKNLKSFDSYKRASGEHQRKMSLVLSSGTKTPHISSKAASVNPADKAWQPFKHREEKQASFGEESFSGLFAGSNIRRNPRGDRQFGGLSFVRYSSALSYGE